MEGNVEVVKELLSSSKEIDEYTAPVEWKDSEGQELSSPPLFVAIDYEYVDVVKLFLETKDENNEKKAKVIDLKDENDYTPLQWSCWNGYLDIVKLLLDHGATADEECLDLAKENNHAEVASLLYQLFGDNDAILYGNLESEDDEDAVMEKACRIGDLSKVQNMMDNGYDYEKWKDKDGKCLGFSPIYMALKYGHMDIVQIFAEKGMEVDAPMTTSNPTPDPISEAAIAEMVAKASMAEDDVVETTDETKP